ncbi:IS66 family transposase [Pseudomonas aeruginosa]|uniref:IS66 family transposase n=1 Tax=Pseudomonas aeruginosa TaxID=287 RepID=UPI0010676454|nr:IS66 family transposase [Pseudomonas aeruginosa]TED74089.1 IS66 family transposase [Pseudomonas aeruginosa]
MTLLPDFDQLNPEQLRAIAAQLMQRVETLDQKVESMDKQIHHYKTVNDKLTHEIAQLKRFKFAKRSEQLNPYQTSLLDDVIDADIAAIEAELETLQPAPAPTVARQKPKRTALPPEFPRTPIHHEPDNTHCQCGCALKRIGEDVSEKLDYTPGVFTVEQHIRGKWVCEDCETLIQAPVPAQVIDKGIPTAGLLAQVMIAKYGDHLPLYRQEKIFGRAGLAIPRSTLAQWVGTCGVQLQPLVDALREVVLGHNVVHADETPVQVLMPGSKKTHRAYVWAYATTASADIRAVVYDFSPSRSGEHARNFLQDWKGKLVCDDFGGYKASFALGVTEIGCMAHARRKFLLSRYLDDGAVPIDNNHIEQQIRPWALGRKNWLFAGSLRSGQRAAALMSLIQSAKLNGHDPYAYLKDVLMRLPTQRASEIAELLPHNWLPLRNL